MCASIDRCAKTETRNDREKKTQWLLFESRKMRGANKQTNKQCTTGITFSPGGADWEKVCWGLEMKTVSPRPPARLGRVKIVAAERFAFSHSQPQPNSKHYQI